MIEKLTTYPRPLPNNPMVVENIGMDNESLFNKINELVDAVNSLRDDCNLLMGYIAPENKCEPAENVQDEMPRCPFCGEELSYAQEIDGGFEILTCDCPAGIWLFGNDKMWHTLGKIKKQLTKGGDNE